MQNGIGRSWHRQEVCKTRTAFPSCRESNGLDEGNQSFGHPSIRSYQARKPLYPSNWSVGMGQPATELSVILRVLSDPTRWRIYHALRQGEASVGSIATALQVAENLVSHHLEVLRRAGIVLAHRDALDARWVYYSLDTERLTTWYTELGLPLIPRSLGA